MHLWPRGIKIAFYRWFVGVTAVIGAALAALLFFSFISHIAAMSVNPRFYVTWSVFEGHIRFTSVSGPGIGGVIAESGRSPGDSDFHCSKIPSHPWKTVNWETAMLPHFVYRDYDLGGPGYVLGRDWSMPIWIPAMCCAVPLAIRNSRRRKPLPATYCAACGYDLRASFDRCPECGTAAPIPPPANLS